MNEGVPLLAAKHLPPRPRHFHLPRPRLHHRLQDGLEARATVILAGPGYGKTSLAARFLQDLTTDSVWYRLDPSDGEPWLFFQYLIHGIRERIPEFGDRSEGLWREMRRSDDPERLADIFIAEAEEVLGGRLIVVLDDVHSVFDGEAASRALRRLLRYLPGALHVFLVGRSLPELGIQSLVAQQQANVISGQELRFNEEETRALLVDTFGLPMTEDAVRAVHARTRGWVAALQLLRQTARLERSLTDLPEELFARTEEEIFDYFGEEVFASEEPEVRDLLLDASPPIVVDADLCAEVLDRADARRLLSGLVRQNLFLSRLEGGRDLYAFDPLFREFLLRKLREVRGESRCGELHRGYATAFERRGDPSHALYHWMESRDGNGLAELLERHGRALLHGGILEPVRDAATLVASENPSSPTSHDLLGEAARLAGDYAAAIGHFEQALAASSGHGDGPDVARAATLQGLAYSLMKTGQPDRSRAVAQDALAATGDGVPALTARILNTLSILNFRAHRHDEAVRGWQRALVSARQARDEHLVRMIAHNLGLPHAVMGDFPRAVECFEILLKRDSGRMGPEEGAAYLNRGRIATMRGDFEAASRDLEDAREIARKWELGGLRADVLEAEGILLRETGNLDAARERFAEARGLLTELGQIELLPGLAEEEAILEALCGDAGAADVALGGAIERRRLAGDPEGIASTLLALGEVRLRGGDTRAALAPLEEAAPLFESVGRRYQLCSTSLWLALARLRAGEETASREAAARALDLASRFGYGASVRRVAALDERFRELLATLPGAPADMVGAPAPVAPLPADGPDLTVRLLGPVEVFRHLRPPIPPRAWKVRRALQIFCLLAASRDHRATKDRIVDAVWGDAPLDSIEKNFHPTISFLRAALNHGHNVTKNFVLFERGAYKLNSEYRYTIDVERFEELLRRARERAGDDPQAARVDYGEALALYRGPFLEEEYEEWTEAPRAHFAGLYRAALSEAADLHHRRLGDEEAAVECLQRLVREDPLDEGVSRSLMQAFGSLGQRAAVEQEFVRLRVALAENLDAEPQEETLQAHRDALAGQDSSRPASPRRRR